MNSSIQDNTDNADNTDTNSGTNSELMNCSYDEKQIFSETNNDDENCSTLQQAGNVIESEDNDDNSLTVAAAEQLLNKMEDDINEGIETINQSLEGIDCCTTIQQSIDLPSTSNAANCTTINMNNDKSFFHHRDDDDDVITCTEKNESNCTIEQKDHQGNKRKHEGCLDNLPKKSKVEHNSNRTIASLLKIDKNPAKYIVPLLQQTNAEKYHTGCVNEVLSYLNKFSNGISEDEIINTDTLDEYQDNDTKIWHAEKIGEGSFGCVLRVTKRNESTLKNEFVRVVKIIPNATMGVSEAVKGARLTHPNVVKVHHAMLIRYICCIEMEYIEGGSLANYIKFNCKKFTIHKDTVKNMLFQCLEVLLLMKQHEIVHSDIKPDNIMVRESFDIAIGDFGVSLQNQTMSSQTLGGSKRYMEPKLKANFNTDEFKPDFSTDLYSLGMTFEELIANSPRNNKVHECIQGLKSKDSSQRIKACYEFASEIIVKENRNFNNIWFNEEEMKPHLRELRKQLILEEMTSYKDFKKATKNDPSLLSEKQFILNALCKIHEWEIITLIDDSLKSDKEIVMTAIKERGSSAVQDVLEELDPYYVLSDEKCLNQISEILADDPESKYEISEMYGIDFSDEEDMDNSDNDDDDDENSD
ncbi:predicted protein [Naegleria gruberi]|uniref:Predicted protein n=1 Tax=Naegleria gruberi TaxID=5762 RepID=D2VTA5_NAEGR|nr:uncharacterized protein NAEGRDRAFT_72231 [Naegleria gruberi]EFC39825.1 predicted protein [Naegleria gruberi]|eukprot:XP_002672569.1 predicted protein [Naegleria gruberi strain NEG-M]